MKPIASLAILSLAASCAAKGGPSRAYEPEMIQSTAAPMPSATPIADTEQAPPMNTEEYDYIAENDFVKVADEPLSTFSIDVDTASYSNVRRFLQQGQLPPADAVRIEELVNYFSYDYPQPRGDRPFSITTEVGAAPWDASHRLVHIGLQGKHVTHDHIPPRNLVFLLDVSGSMASANKLGLLKKGFTMLAEKLGERDHVAIVVYAGASGAVLPPTSGADKRAIIGALERLSAGGSTNGGAGIQLAYALAEKNYDPKAINRVILATDGDFNVGTTDRGSLVRLIEDKRRTGIYLTVLGFGTGNLKDSTMEQLADRGNGNYAYIDSVAEARKVLVDEANSTLVTIAEDVKIQVEFNPAQVSSYRLIGYENRKLENQDFNDDKKDAGDIGADHTVTALYEVVPAGAEPSGGDVDALKYQEKGKLSRAAASGDLMTVKLRYKDPGAAESKLLSRTVAAEPQAEPSESFRFSAAVAGFGMLLRKSEHAGDFTFAAARRLAQGSLGADRRGYRAELVRLIAQAAQLSGEPAKTAEIAE